MITKNARLGVPRAKIPFVQGLTMLAIFISLDAALADRRQVPVGDAGETAFVLSTEERGEYTGSITDSGYRCPEAKLILHIYSTGDHYIKKIWCGEKDGTDEVNVVYRDVNEIFGSEKIVNPYAMNPPRSKPAAWINDHLDRERLASAIRRHDYECPEAKTADIPIDGERVLLIECGPADGSATVTGGLSYRLDVSADNSVTRWEKPAKSWWPWS